MNIKLKILIYYIIIPKKKLIKKSLILNIIL